MYRSRKTAVNILTAALIAVCVMGYADIQLVQDDKTSYEIVKPEKASDVDNYAVKTLVEFLKEKTGGADFAVVEFGNISKDKKHIFIGSSDSLLKEMKEQEFSVKSKGDDIFLYGKGLHGNLYAVLDFMENTLGWRWYSKFDKPAFTVVKALEVKPFDRKGSFDFEYRIPIYETTWDYLNRMNMDFTERNEKWKKSGMKYSYPSGVVSYKVELNGVHNTFSYIPPEPGADRYKLSFVTNKNYFKSNPEFFALKGIKRVPNHQLCYSNPSLRAELTKNVMEHIKTEGSSTSRLAISPEDNPGSFCECTECKRLEAAYKNPGGPYYDYIIEFANILKEKYPEAKVGMTAYRLSQTQKPPFLPEGKTFPDNVSLCFANVEDKVDLDWNSPENHPSYEDLLAWKKVISDVSTWYYPNPYGAASWMPLGNTERLVNDLRLMKKIGVTGVFYEFTTSSVWSGDGVTELQKYLICKLLQKVNADVEALTKEFTDYQYGLAASAIRKYMNELEEARKTSKEHLPLIITNINFDKEFSYLTNERIYRWQGYFDKMEKDTASDKRCLKNVKRLRRCLDIATLGKWNSLLKDYPDYFKDHLVYKSRVSMLKNVTAYVDDCEIMIKTGGVQKPLPPQFDGIDKTLIRQFVPANTRNGPINPKIKLKLDSDAAFGYGATIDMPDMPFSFGFYQNDNKKHGAKCKLEKTEIKAGSYQLYKLGDITISPNSIIWFSSKSWLTQLAVGDRLYEPGESNIWEAFVSLKFDGPTYGGTAEDDLVLCDRIIFVKK